MNLPRPITKEIEGLGNEAMRMVHAGSQTVHELMENLGSALPYALIVLMGSLLAKYGIEEGFKHFKKVYRDEAYIGEDNS